MYFVPKMMIHLYVLLFSWNLTVEIFVIFKILQTKLAIFKYVFGFSDQSIHFHHVTFDCFGMFKVLMTKMNSDGSNTILLNIKQTRTSFFEHHMNSNVFFYWWSNSNTLFWLRTIAHRISNIVGPITKDEHLLSYLVKCIRMHTQVSHKLLSLHPPWSIQRYV